MLDRVVSYSQLLHCVDELSARWRIVGPVARRTPRCRPPLRYFYEQVERADQLDFGFSYCVYGPKPHLMPPTETLFVFRKSERGFSAFPVFSGNSTALVGVHPCDLHAIQTLDAVFAADYRDPHYFHRREHLFLVGIDCATPCHKGVFCRDMEANSIDAGYDVMLYPLDRMKRVDGVIDPAERFGVVFGSDAGRAWLLNRDAPDRTRLPTDLDELDFAAYQRRKAEAFPFALRTRLDHLPQMLSRSYDSLLWQAVGQRCYSCGSCNLVCPTCYCFDMQDQNDLPTTSGCRERTWDGCQLRDFATVAGNHNFRARAAERLRHRIMRKGSWTTERSGRKGCVGCARCDRACTAHINSVEIYNQLAEED